MYEIRKNGTHLSYEDELRYVRTQPNGVTAYCEESEADAIEIYNSFNEPLEGVEVRWLSGPGKLALVTAEGAALAQASTEEPAATVGVLAEGFPEWEAGKDYAQYELFAYGNRVGFARQALTSSDVYPPFSAGTEALYGVRPVPDTDGVYPYAYNMAASLGMRVSHEGTIYECIQAIDPALYPPGEIEAHFREEE